MRRPIPASHDHDRSPDPAARLTRTILELAARIPASGETGSTDPRERTRALTRIAAGKAALAAGSLALPAGPLGWLTLAPELALVWRIQRQLVADIAGCWGVQADLGRSQMLYCLFRHTAAQALRDVGVQVGARVLVQELPLRAIERVAADIGLQVSGRALGQGLARWLPVAGSLGVAGYAWYDTTRVANTALALFADPSGDAPRHRRPLHAH
ncbi:MAG: hypothetical protein DWB45_06950 [Xanthomonadales bacterium]|nr:hypothetical protein [Xanthomonadales bacterium]MDL1869771.1 hypothetical protein [Gammaproteobacteria bacterium PRO6]